MIHRLSNTKSRPFSDLAVHFITNAGGTIVKKTLKNSLLRVDTGCLVAFTRGVDYDIAKAGNLKSMFLGGEGLFLATLSGTGVVLLPELKIKNQIYESHSIPSAYPG